MTNFIQLCYLLTAFLVIFGIKQMASPKLAEKGIFVSGLGVLLAVIVTFGFPKLFNFGLIFLGIASGVYIGWLTARKVPMINMPQMIALYNGMGGGAAGGIAAIELLRYHESSLILRILALIGAMIGSVAFSGSIIAFMKLQDLIKQKGGLPKPQWINFSVFSMMLLLGVGVLCFPQSQLLLATFFVVLFVLGILATLPIGGANMPIVISLFNAMTGLAVAFNGLVLNNAALIIAGTVVGASGTLLTQLMAKAMNKSVFSILFSSLQAEQRNETSAQGRLKPIEVNDAAIMLAYSKKVIIIPGYGMAVAQAQHKIWELTTLLEAQGVEVKFAIHPVAGRMPGHMNVLLAEAGVPYEKLYDLEEINADFLNTDCVLVMGANDVVNPSAQTDSESPIYGMPILEAHCARNVLVIKRGQGKGFSGIENNLFTMDNTRMLYGDGQAVANKLIQAVKLL